LHIEEASSSLLRVEEGSLYPALHRLDKADLIEAEWTVTSNGRRARIYRLTKSGRKRLKEIEESWTTLAEGVRRVLRWA
jgi:DNA-binding PadR family transcriptional regulator